MDCCYNSSLVTLRAYLKLIRPWAMGKDDRGWINEDFDGETCEMRLDPSQIIFPMIMPGYFTAFDLNPETYEAALELTQLVSNFNSTLLVLNQARFHYRDPEYLDLIVLLHAGIIGTKGTNGLHDAYLKLERLINF